MPHVSKAALFALLLCPVVPLASPVIVDTHAAAPAVITVVVDVQSTETGNPTVPNAIDVTPADWHVNGQVPTSVSRYAVPHDEAPAQAASQPNTFPVTTRERVYLWLPQPMAEGTLYQVTGPYGNSSLTFSSRATFNESIHCNQAGYSGQATARFCNLGVFAGSGGSVRFTVPIVYDVVNESTGSVAFTGTASREFDDTATTGVPSGEWVYRIPLDAVPSGGPYFVSARGFGRSRSFGIGGVYSQRAALTAVRGLYHQRCGIELAQPYTQWTRPICSLNHRQIADIRQTWNPNTVTISPGAPMITVIGGYHDAGDFDRRPYHVIIPILMLSYFEAWPAKFTDGQFNLPESGHGVPDMLSEALWGLKSWYALQIMDSTDPKYGGVRGGTGESRIAVYGVDNAANDPGAYGTWDVMEDVTAYSAGMFAHASRLLRPYDAARADDLLNRARLAWAYLARTGNVSQVNSYYLYASEQLYLSTGESAFHDIFKADANAIVVGAGTWPNQYLPGNFGPSGAQVQTAHFTSYAISTAQPTDPTLVAAIKARVIREATNGGYMQVNVDTAPYEVGASRFVAWGSSTAQGRYADMYAFASLFTADAVQRQKFINAASVLADYTVGVNPMGQSFITGIGTDAPNNPLHLDSYFTRSRGLGVVPGITVYGSTEGASGAAYQVAATGKLFPAFTALPIQRRYVDAWSAVNNSEFTTFETVVWNAVMFAFLSDAPAVQSPIPDAGVSVDASADASNSSSDVASDSPGATDVLVTDATAFDSGPALVCVMPPPVLVCGYPVDGGAH